MGIYEPEKWLIKQVLNMVIDACRENYTYSKKFEDLYIESLEESKQRIEFLIKYAKKMKSQTKFSYPAPAWRAKEFKKAQEEAGMINHYKRRML